MSELVGTQNCWFSHTFYIHSINKVSEPILIIRILNHVNIESDSRSFRTPKGQMFALDVMAIRKRVKKQHHWLTDIDVAPAKGVAYSYIILQYFHQEMKNTKNDTFI